MLALGIAALLTLVGCSVSTPRHGFTTTAIGPAGGQPAPGGTAPGETSPPPGTIGGGVPAPGASVSGGGGASNPSSGGTTGGETSGGGSTATGSGSTQGGSTGSNARVVGVTKNSITLSAVAGFDGQYGPILDVIYDRGFQTWIDDVNAHGGIHGRKVAVNKVGHNDSVEGGVAACKKIQSNGSFLAVSIVGFGGSDVSLSDCLDRAGIITLALNLSGFSPRWRHVYSAGDAGKQTKPMASFIRNVIGDHGKIGIIHTNDSLNNSARTGLVSEMKRLHMNLVHEETVEVSRASYLAEVTRMKNSNATTVALIVNTNEVVSILRDARAIDYQPNWTGNYWVTDENAAAQRSLIDGIKAIRNYSSTNAPAFADYKAKASKYGHGDVANSTTMALYGIGLIVGRVLENAGANPTKAGLPKAIEAITNYNNGITMALSFGSGVRVADVGMWPIQCCNSDNTWKGIGGAKASF
jgi:ABC-type branched-subunit amino acid transport system substrate-binding protein